MSRKTVSLYFMRWPADAATVKLAERLRWTVGRRTIEIPEYWPRPRHDLRQQYEERHDVCDVEEGKMGSGGWAPPPTRSFDSRLRPRCRLHEESLLILVKKFRRIDIPHIRKDLMKNLATTWSTAGIKSGGGLIDGLSIFRCCRCCVHGPANQGCTRRSQ